MNYYFQKAKVNASSVRILLYFLIVVPLVVQADPAITTGSTTNALAYYKKEQKLFPGLKLTNGLTPLDDVAIFLGYPISGKKLETLDPWFLCRHN